MSFLGECPPWMSQQVIQEALTSNCQSNAVFSSESYGWRGKLKNSLTVKCTKCIMWLSFWETDREGNLGITVLFFLFVTLLAHEMGGEPSFGG